MENQRVLVFYFRNYPFISYNFILLLCASLSAATKYFCVSACLLLPSTFVCQLVCYYRVLLFASLSATEYSCLPAYLLQSTFVCQLVCCYRVLLFASLSATEYFCLPACLLQSTFVCQLDCYRLLLCASLSATD
jgi:hypothetical protein